MESEIVKAEQHHGQRALITREQLQAEVEQRRLLGEYVKSCMVQGEDYGVIPGTKKPTLLKPGAEKLLALFHCSPVFELIEKTEDFERGFFSYMFRVQIVAPRGGVLAEGYGSANSMESRYRWRDGKRKCPNCESDAALLKSKKEGEGFFCWTKKGGCGATFPEGDKRITEQQVGRVENPDIYDLANTILKMAKKRAQVDGAIALARCSDMFTQDVEDMAPPEQYREPEPPRQEPQPVLREAPRGPPPTLSPAVAFGPHKGRPIAELTDAELSETIELAHEKLLEQPKATWAKAMREKLAHMESERLRREPPATEKPERKPLTDKEAERKWKNERKTMLVGFGDFKSKTLEALADDEVTLAAEYIQGLLERKEPMMAAAAAKDMLLFLGLELEFRMNKAGAAAIV